MALESQRFQEFRNTHVLRSQPTWLSRDLRDGQLISRRIDPEVLQRPVC